MAAERWVGGTKRKVNREERRRRWGEPREGILLIENTRGHERTRVSDLGIEAVYYAFWKKNKPCLCL